MKSSHPNEKYHLLDENIIPLNRSNTKWLKIGYSPHRSFNLAFVFWDQPTNNMILLPAYDFHNLGIFLDPDSDRNSDHDLSTAILRFNRKNPEIVHIIEKNTFKMISFLEKTLQNMLNIEHLYHYKPNQISYLHKVNLYTQKLREHTLYDKIELNDLPKLIDKVFISTEDRRLIGEFVTKFPTSLINVASLPIP